MCALLSRAILTHLMTDYLKTKTKSVSSPGGCLEGEAVTNETGREVKH